MNVSVTVTDDEMVMDWTGSDRWIGSDGAQQGFVGPIALPYGKTLAFCSLIFKALTTPDTPVVSGNFRPLRVRAEPGSLMDAVPPMPTFTQP